MATGTADRVADSASSPAILTAKICPAVLPPHAVARPRLVELLTREDWRVASMTAGPGLGKSVLLLQWLATMGPERRAIVALDDVDNSPPRFWRYIVASLERAQPQAFAKSAHASATTCRPELLVDQILEDARAVDEGLVLTIEDLHVIRNSSILAGITHLVEHLPPNLRLLFTSRQDVALPIARWRARAWLIDIRAADLAFTDHETGMLFDALGETRLEPAEIEQLTAVTEGWVAALQLAAVAMRDNDAHQVASGFCGRSRMIADYLSSEIIDRQSDDMREFMADIAIADFFDPEFCTALTGRGDSARRLRELASTTHFLVALEDERSTYRYHHLLRDVLRADLAHRDPERRSRLHLSAADIQERRGEIAAAATHLVSASELDRAFDLAFGSVHERWGRGELEAVRCMLDAFPIEHVGAAPHRMLVFALALALCGRFDDSREWLARAERALAHVEGAPMDDLALHDALRLLLFTVDGRDDESIDAGRRALGRCGAGGSAGIDESHVRSLLIGSLLLTDELDEARRVLRAGHEGCAPALVVLEHGLAARFAHREGSLDAAVDRARRACIAAEAFGISNHVVTIDAHLATAGVLIDRNEIAAAAEAIGSIDEILDRFPSFTHHVLTRLEEGRIALARDGLDAALELISELRCDVDTKGCRGLAHRVAALEARLRIDADDLLRAQLLIDRLPRESTWHDLLQARLLLESGRPSEAAAILGRLDVTNVRDCTEAQLLVVRWCLVSGADVEPEVRRLVDLAAPERFTRLVLHEGLATTRIVRQCAETSGAVGADRFAVELGAPPRRSHGRSELIAPLSQRERDVLRFLPSRLTTKEIAAECFMSVNTVKAHLKRIYRKLGVGTRAEAVDRAILLGELPS